ncbi:MAG TPA: phage major capsid protein [Candidatus Binatia bacterium]
MVALAKSVRCDLPARDRAFSIDRNAIDPEKRTADIIFATETPAKTWDWDLGEYFEILDCGPGADLRRLNNGGAFLCEHDRNIQIGVHLKAETATDSEIGKCCKATVKFGNSAKAKEEFEDVKEGIRSKISVSYQPLEMVLERTSEEGDFYRVTRWEALENSLVSVPLDDNCQVSRSEAKPKVERHAVTILNPHKLIPMKVRNRSLFYKADDGAPSGGNGGPSQADLDAQKRHIEEAAEKRAQELIKERQKLESDINDIVVAVRKRDKKDFGELAAKYLKTDKPTVDGFRALVLSSDEFKPFEVRFEGEDENSPRIEVVGDRRSGRILTPGEAFIADERVREWGKKKRSSGGRVQGSMSVNVPNPRVRATATTSQIGMTGVSFEQQTGIIGLPIRRLTVKDLLAQGTTGAQAIKYPQEDTFTNAADVVAEGAAKPEASWDLSNQTATVEKIAVWTKVSDELVADFPAIMSYINERLPLMVELKEEAELLNGTGDLVGILQQSGILAQAKGVLTAADAMYKALTKIRTAGPDGGGFEPDGYVVHPTDWEALRLSKDGNNQYYAGGPFMGPYGNNGIAADSLWGKPVVITAAIAQGTALAGAFKLGAQVFMREGMTIDSTNTDQDDFIKNLMTIRAEIREALAVYRPKAFCKITGL